jgi:hypothetical protein
MQNRTKALYFDLTAGVVLFFSLFVVAMLGPIMSLHSEVFSAPAFLLGNLIFPVFFVMVYGLGKDLLLGRSAGKIKYHLQVVDYSSGRQASLWQLLFRNVTLVFWPIELFWINTYGGARRLGDYLAGTEVVAYRFAPQRKKTFSYLLPLVVVLSISACFTLPFWALDYRVNRPWQYNPADKNPELSRQLSESGAITFSDRFTSFEAEVYDRSVNAPVRMVNIVVKTKLSKSPKAWQPDMMALRAFCDGILGDTLYRASAKIICHNPGSGRQVVIYPFRDP